MMGSKRSIGHFEFVRGTGSVLRGIAPWDWFGDSIVSFIGYYKVAREQGTWVEIGPQNNLIVQFDTTPTQATAQPQNG